MLERNEFAEAVDDSKELRGGFDLAVALAAQVKEEPL